MDGWFAGLREVVAKTTTTTRWWRQTCFPKSITNIRLFCWGGKGEEEKACLVLEMIGARAHTNTGTDRWSAGREFHGELARASEMGILTYLQLIYIVQMVGRSVNWHLGNQVCIVHCFGLIAANASSSPSVHYIDGDDMVNTIGELGTRSGTLVACSDMVATDPPTASVVTWTSRFCSTNVR